MSQSPPSTLGKYEIIREIARSNDIVYEAYDPIMHRRVAIKELAVPGGSSVQQREDRINRFRREARAAGSLVHPNIVTIYEVGEHEGRHFIAMEYLEGQTLRQLMDQKSPLDAEKAVDVAKGVLAALGFAHAHGVIHRDVKPDNIQILPDGTIKLTDFGVARLTFEPNLTMDGQVFGTPSYMSPEQIRGGDLDATSDLFSLGVILYEMLGGSKPFTGDNVVAIAYAIANTQPPRLGTVAPGLWAAVERSLEKMPSLRWRSADEFGGALKQAMSAPVAPPPIFGAAPTQSMPMAAPLPTQAPPTQVYGQPYGQSYGQGYGKPYGGTPVQMPQTTRYVPQPVALPPRPPRPPLISAQAKREMSRWFWGLAIMGLILGGFVYAFWTILGVVNEDARRGSGQVTVPLPTTPGTVPDEPTIVAPESRAGANGGVVAPNDDRVTQSPDELMARARDLLEAAWAERNPNGRQILLQDSSRAWSEAAIAAGRDSTAVLQVAALDFDAFAQRCLEAGDTQNAGLAASLAAGFREQAGTF